MSTRHAVHAICLLAMILLLPAANARADLAAWDQAKVTALGKELLNATNDLYETFRKQPQSSVATTQSQAYYRLKQNVRLLHLASHEFASSLEKGEGREQTQVIYENLMQVTRSARDDAGKVFVSHDISERAAAVRGVLNQLGPYYDPDFPTLAPHPNIEPGAAR